MAYPRMAAATLSGTKDDKKTKKQCFGCGDELTLGHLGIHCVQDHHICTDCSKTFVVNIFENPESGIPPKCSICNVEISLSVNITIISSLPSPCSLVPSRFSDRIYLLTFEVQLAGNREKSFSGRHGKVPEYYACSYMRKRFLGRRGGTGLLSVLSVLRGALFSWWRQFCSLPSREVPKNLMHHLQK